MVGTVPYFEKELPGWWKWWCVQRPWGREEGREVVVKSMMGEEAGWSQDPTTGTLGP